MNYTLSEVLRQIGHVNVPSTKGDLSFAIDEDGFLWVVYREQLPAGNYTDPDTYKFVQTGD
jgi:hypothetical protein